MPELSRFSAKTEIDWDEVWTAFDRDGGLIVEDFIAQDLLARLQAEAAPLITTKTPGSTTEGLWTEFHGEQTKRITGLPTKSPAWVELLCDERYQAMGDRYLGAGDYWLNTGQLICIGPGETPQMLHRDELNWPQAIRKEEITVTAIFALLAALIMPNLGSLSSRTLRQRAEGIAARLELARQRSVLTGIPHRLLIVREALWREAQWRTERTGLWKSSSPTGGATATTC